MKTIRQLFISLAIAIVCYFSNAVEVQAQRPSLTNLASQIETLETQVSDLEAQLAAVNEVPAGSVLDWWQFDNEPVPDGYAICNGQIVNGFQTPNLTNRFVRGANGVGDIGTSGGSNSQSLSVTTVIPPHSHTWLTLSGGGGGNGFYTSGDGSILASSGATPSLSPGSNSGSFDVMGIFSSSPQKRTSFDGGGVFQSSLTSVNTVPIYLSLLKIVKLP